MDETGLGGPGTPLQFPTGPGNKRKTNLIYIIPLLAGFTTGLDREDVVPYITSAPPAAVLTNNLPSLPVCRR